MNGEPELSRDCYPASLQKTYLLHFEPVLPSEEYVRRRDARHSRVAHYEKIHIRMGNVRLILAVFAVIVAWASLIGHHLSPWWLAVPVAAFVGIAAYHSRILRARELAERAAAFYERGLARVEDRWAGSGETGDRFDDPHHVYAADLDLFGKGSLFQLLSTARTRMGEDTLAQWLLSPATLEQIRERHAAVSELRDQLDLREDLAVLGEDVGVGVHPEELLKWAESPNQMKPLWIRWLAPCARGAGRGGSRGVGWLGNGSAVRADRGDRSRAHLLAKEAAGGSAARNRARISRSRFAFGCACAS